jgi:hypothetical protein
LLSLGDQRIVDKLFLHVYHTLIRLRQSEVSRLAKGQTIFSPTVAVDPQPGVLLVDLPTFHVRKCLNGRQPTVLGECQRDGVQGRRKCPHGVLLDRRDLVMDGQFMLIFEDVRQHTSSAALDTATAQLISAAPPPYTTRSSTTRLRTTQRASCNARLASSTI